MQLSFPGLLVLSKHFVKCFHGLHCFEGLCLQSWKRFLRCSIIWIDDHASKVRQIEHLKNMLTSDNFVLDSKHFAKGPNVKLAILIPPPVGQASSHALTRNEKASKAFLMYTHGET